MGLRLIASAAAAFTAIAAPAAAQNAIDGTYVDSGGYVEITVERCGDVRCGTISRIIRRKAGGSDLDVHNDDPALRNRPILGLTLLQGLRWDDGAWRGEVYNPEDGGTYRTEVRSASGGGLEVKGCLAFICRTRVWTAAD